jgi:spore coat protein CotH
MKKFLTFLLITATLAGCDGYDKFPGADEFAPSKDNTEQTPETPEQPETPETSGWDYSPVTTTTIGHAGISYIWDENVIPEITISITKDEWNNLLAAYDKNSHNKEYFPCDITYKKGNDTHTLYGSGVRLRGNTSRRRPEAHKNDGKHVTNGADWQHCHFGINFKKFNTDGRYDIHGIRKFNLKWFKDDPCYVRELFCYDLFRRAGI